MAAGDLESSRRISNMAEVSLQTGCTWDLELKRAHEEWEGSCSHSLSSSKVLLSASIEVTGFLHVDIVIWFGRWKGLTSVYQAVAVFFSYRFFRSRSFFVLTLLN